MGGSSREKKKMDPSDKIFPQQCHRLENKMLGRPRHTAGPDCGNVLLVEIKGQGRSKETRGGSKVQSNVSCVETRAAI